MSADLTDAGPPPRTQQRCRSGPGRVAEHLCIVGTNGGPGRGTWQSWTNKMPQRNRHQKKARRSLADPGDKQDSPGSHSLRKHTWTQDTSRDRYTRAHVQQATSQRAVHSLFTFCLHECLTTTRYHLYNKKPFTLGI